MIHPATCLSASISRFQKVNSCEWSSSDWSSSGSSSPGSSSTPLPPDLIIYYYKSAKPLENRWAFTSEVIDYSLICDLGGRLPTYDVKNLKRIKICGVTCDDMEGVLTAVSIMSEKTLEQMDIDEFKIIRGTILKTNRFRYLRTLSIERFNPVPQAGIEAEPTTPTMVRFKAPVLSQLYLGPDAIKYISFSNPRSIRHLITDDPAENTASSYLLNRGLLRFPNLTKLELNRIREANSDLIVRLATPQEQPPVLQDLHCNFTGSDCATSSYREHSILSLLVALYERLQNATRERGRTGPTIYFLNVRLELSKPIAGYHLNKVLFKTHQQFHSLGRLAYPCLQITDCGFPVELYLANRDLRNNLNTFYPNIRAVHLKLKDSVASRTADEPAFLQFLSELNSLVKLKLFKTRLSSDFYTRLSEATRADGRRVVATLNAFIIIEQGGFQGDFDFLAEFSSLRYLHVRLASKDQLIRLVQTNRRAAFEFRFDFGFEREPMRRNEPYYSWTIRNEFDWLFDRGVKTFSYYVTFDKRHRNQRTVPSLHQAERFTTLEEVLAYLNARSLDGLLLRPHLNANPR